MITFPDIDPVALSLGPLQIRWYALAYLSGILGGWKYAKHLASLPPLGRRPNANDIDEIVPWLVLGIILGGRIGYVLFYNLPYFIANPLHIPFVWEGGMSFHGGLLGVATAIILYARRQKFSVLALGDVIATVVPVGLFFGRIANFINGELFGRVTNLPWAVVFPYGGELPRHPSQFYEAFLEGIVLFTTLFFFARKQSIREKPGVLFGIFLIGYAASRIIVEYFREPDPQIGLILQYFSLGQILSVPMALVGAVLISKAYSSQKT